MTTENTTPSKANPDHTVIKLPFTGVCAHCKKYIAKGSLGTQVAGRGLHHPECVAEATSVN